MTVARTVGGALRFAATHGAHAVWRTLDYAYVLRRQAEGALRRGGAEVYRVPDTRVPPDVVLVPGVYESWQFLRPLAAVLHAEGHAVHVLPALGYNIGPIPAGAAVLGAYLRTQDLRDVVVVAHSKGGLIGKLAMREEDPDGRIAAMVAVNTPFAGSAYARWIPLAAVRAFVPTDATLLSLAADREVNSRITSVFSRWDPHIPAGSVLDGAVNIELSTPGHFRVLDDPRLGEVVLTELRRAVAPGSGAPSPVGPLSPVGLVSPADARAADARAAEAPAVDARAAGP
ncbi:MAG: alpha/beta hydrolase, partial [Actinotalea sp.]|nr:alpha/beta hydrolase [Actinotalea sp.]